MPKTLSGGTGWQAFSKRCNQGPFFPAETKSLTITKNGVIIQYTFKLGKKN